MKVSVVSITYNHERFIAQALESVLTQECDFEFEYLVGDDASTDWTAKIIEQYTDRFPSRLVPVLRKVNVGAQANLADLLSRCRGQYVAWLDGDDYWTSPHKLQRQVDFLDSNPDCALCFHGFELIHSDGTPFAAQPNLQAPQRSGIEELLARSIEETHLATLTVMYRWGLVEIPDWWGKALICDYPLHVLHAQYGWIGYIAESMAAYRVHEGGGWSGRSGIANVEEFIDVLQKLDRALGNRYHAIVRTNVAYHRKYEFTLRYAAATQAFAAGDRAEAAAHLRWIVGHLTNRGAHSARDLTILTMRGVSPWALTLAVRAKRALRHLFGGRKPE